MWAQNKVVRAHPNLCLLFSFGDLKRRKPPTVRPCLVTVHHSFHYIRRPVCVHNGCNFSELIHPVLSIHSGAMRTRLSSPPPCRRTWHNLTGTHRQSPFTARRPTQKLPGAKHRGEKGPFCFCLCFTFLCLICKYGCGSATTSRLVSYDHQTLTWESWQRLKQWRRPGNKEAHLSRTVRERRREGG